MKLLSFIEQWQPIAGVLNGLCVHSRACQQCVYFLRARVVKFFLRAVSTLEIQMVSSEHFEYFVNFPIAGISLLLIGHVILCLKLIIWLTPPKQNNSWKARAVQLVLTSYSQLCPVWCQITSRSFTWVSQGGRSRTWRALKEIYQIQSPQSKVCYLFLTRR